MADSPTQSPAQTDNPRNSQPGDDSVRLENPAIGDSVTVPQHSQNSEILPTKEDVLQFIGGKPGFPKNRDPSLYIVTSDKVVGNEVPEEIQKNPNKTSFASFGNQGTTASVNSDGQIIQITKYLPAGRSKFFSVDRWSTPAPHKIQERAEDLMDNATNSYSVGFALDDFEDSQLDFVCDRWPRFTRPIGNCVFRMQYFACDGTIFQQFVLEKCPSQDPVEGPSDDNLLSRLITQVELYGDILIRDLDPEAKDYQFNTSKSSDTKTYFTHLRNNQYSLVRTHTYLPPGPSTDAGPSTQTVHTDTEFSVELVMTAFMNGIPLKLELFGPYCDIDISRKDARAEFESFGRLEITVAYKLQLVQPKMLDPWKAWLIPASGLKRMRIAYSKPGFRDVHFSQNKLINFKIRRNLEHILSVCSIPITNRDSTDHRSETSTPVAESEGFLEKFEMQDSDDDHEEESDEQHNENHKQEGQEQHDEDDEQGGQEQHNEDHEQQVEEQEPDGQEPDGQEPDGEGKYNPIVLTCGDMSGHLIIGAAGFSAFQFLIAMHKFLQGKLEDPTKCTQCASRLPSRQRNTTNDTSGSISGVRCTHYMQIEGLARRIRDVCKGHMDLIFKTPRAGSGENEPGWSSFCGSNRSVTRGTDALGGNSRSGSFIDDASRLIMAQEFYSISTEESARKDLPEASIKDISDSWFAQLEIAEKRRERGPYAFARSTDKLTNTDNYYLEDHCWIWTTLKAIEKTWSTLIPNLAERNKKQKASPKNRTRKNYTPWYYSWSDDEGENDDEGKNDDTPRFYSSKDAQRHIIKHFTTENPSMNRRMLAVFRSSSETRFIFRSRDTGLFHCMGLKFFNMAESDSILDVWKNTLLAQAIHEDNQSNEWVSPLKYTLALVMACKGLKINRSSINEIFEESKEVLLANAGSPWANGLFPGSLNPSTKAPEVFKHATSREAHWTATFEVPYVLWMHAKETLEKGAPDLERKDGEGGQDHRDSHSKEIKTTKEVAVTGKRMPFNNLIDQRSITEPPDEWLYNEPDFLMFVPENNSRQDEYIPVRLQKLEKPESKFRAPSHATSSSTPLSRTAGAIVDIRRSPKGNNIGGVFIDPLKDITMMNNDTISQKLGDRSSELAKSLGVVKKRFAWLPYADADTARHCWLATSDSERENMLSFFEKHFAYENFFFDDTTAALNTWKTELQLAFYQLHGENQGFSPGGIPWARQVDFPVKESDGSQKKISRATMGFRFDGDFFDRYWNCHFIEYKPAKSREPGKNENQDPDIQELIDLLRPSMLPGIESGKQPWRQRKVLELILFDRILEEITTSTENIMDRIRAALKIIRENVLSESKDSTDQDNAVSRSIQKRDALEDSLQAADFVSKMKGEDYLEFSKQSQGFEQILRVLDDDLGENIEQIERWKNREQDRAPEQPRWTRNDERRYRTTITKMLASNSQKIRRLDRCRFNVQSLKTSLESTREYIRDDLNLRGAEDVRLFTYVTATFLPISFATGVFSMGDFPGGALLGSMIGLAVFALLLTAVALVHDKHLAIFARLFKDFVLGLHPLRRIKKLLHIGQSSSGKEDTPQVQNMSEVEKKKKGPKQEAAFSKFRRRPWGKPVAKQRGMGEV